MPLNSPYPSVKIPNVDIWEFLFTGFDDSLRSRALFTSDDGSQSYNGFGIKETALHFAESLQENFSWTKGQVLAIVSENSIHIPPVIWGTLYVGGIVSPANPGYEAHELLRQFKDSEASAVVTQQSFLPAVLKAATEAGIPHSRVVVLPDARICVSPFAPTGGIWEFTDMLSSRGGKVAKAQIDPQIDDAFLVYSSGTTGLPKGVQLTHRNIIANVLMFDTMSSINQSEQSEDVVLAFLPFFHIYGLTVLLHHPFYRRAHVIVMPRFSLAHFCAMVESHRVTVAYIVPPVASQLLQSDLPAQNDMSSIKHMTSGAAPLSQDLVQALYARRGFKLLEGYGLSETSPAAFMMSLADFPNGIGTVGRLLPNQQVKLLDIHDPSIEVTHMANQPGEICIRGPNVFKGYLKNKSATRASFTPDGFLRTGDVGVIDPATGYLRVTDRIKELIKYKGFQVAPAELEGILMGHEGVADVCVIGVQDAALATEVPRAYVVRAEGWHMASLGRMKEAAESEEIRRWLEMRVANHKKLRGGLYFLKELPRTTSGKILRRVIKELVVPGIPARARI